ncbi:hypothetical protein [Frankia sp. QA3]|uniref:hypothetical protein n=1 Tax=Frankia sp. QA3 TaxID=710111 RepID=UPI000269C763|nr:hypothetical protein [Frankia sp. QA3]EIV93624.1 hypothetical protein FraQA3DRAFT_3335 [Frankia sp. QA3]
MRSPPPGRPAGSTGRGADPAEGPPPDVGALLARARLATLAAFEPTRLCRLALVPEWTDTTAVLFGLVPADELAALLAQLDEAGLIERRRALGPRRTIRQVFWLRASRRDEVGRHLRGLGLDVDAEVDALSEVITEAIEASAGELAREFAPWLEVAVQHRRDHSGSSLFQRVDSLVTAAGPGPGGRPAPYDLPRRDDPLRRDDQSRRDPPPRPGVRFEPAAGLAAAARLVAAARTIGAICGGTLAEAARRAGWRLDRAHRDAQDAEYLRDYQNRAEAEDALGELLADDGPDTPWAVHLLGAGGIGKTMVLRYLASGGYAAARGIAPFPVARVDFDHLDPRYPEHRPAEVLLALADELAGYGASRGWYRSYRRFRDAANALHEQLGRAGPEPPPAEQVYGSAIYPDHGPVRSTAGALRAAAAQTIRALFDEVVRTFARVLRELGRPRVVLVLDTCEELAKLYAPGTAAPAIDRTFDLLERLHAELPGVRVVLAGRRPLVPPPDDGQRAAGPVLLVRDYVRVVPVAGFTAAEAHRYLDAPRTDVDAGLDDMDLDSAQATVLPGRLGGLQPTPPGGALRAALLERARMPPTPAGEVRYNPFELAAYREWIAREPELDPAVLRAAGDPLVERRIIARLADDDARGALAIAAELGRFDLGMISPALRRAGLDPRAAFDGLAAQEWTHVRALGPRGEPLVIEVDEHLRERIRVAVAAEPDRYPLDRARLGRDAAALVTAGPLAAVTAEAVETAVRLLPVADAAYFWADLEERIVVSGEWGWAAQVCVRAAGVERLRAEGTEASPTPRPPEPPPLPSNPTILAAILATQAAARIHAGDHVAAQALWAGVLDHAPRHPLAEHGGVLRARAVLGLLASGGSTFAPFGAGVSTTASSISVATWAYGRVAKPPRPSDSRSFRPWPGTPRPADLWPTRPADSRESLGGLALDDVPAGSLLAAAEALAEGALPYVGPGGGDRSGVSLAGTGGLSAAGGVVAGSVRVTVEFGTDIFRGRSGRLAAAGQFIRREADDLLGAARGAPGADDPAVALVTELVETILALRLPAAAGPSPARLLGAIERFEPAAARPWADWVAPPGLVDRAHLAVLLLRARGVPPARPPDLSAGWLDEILRRTGDVDAERRVAAAVHLTLDHHVIRRGKLERFTDHLGYVAGRHPTSWLHRQVRPLAVEVADAWALLDEPHRAAEIIAGYREAARTDGDDLAAVEQCELALLALCRRYRTTEFSPSIRQLARAGSPPVRAEAWLVLALVNGQRPDSPAEAGSWHAWWRCQDHESLTRGAQPGSPVVLPAPPSADEPGPPPGTSVVDRLEWRTLTLGPARSTAADPRELDRLTDPQARLRGAALLRDPRRPSASSRRARQPSSGGDPVDREMSALAPLAGARAAMAVAEVLAPRLPAHAAALLEHPSDLVPRSVADRLRDAGDEFGAQAAAMLGARLRQRAGQPPNPETAPPFSSRLVAWPGWLERLELVQDAPKPGSAPWGRRPASLPADTTRPLPPPELSVAVVPPPPWLRPPVAQFPAAVPDDRADDPEPVVAAVPRRPAEPAPRRRPRRRTQVAVGVVAAVLLVVAVAALILVFSRSGRTVGTGEGTSWWDGNVALPAVLLPGIILVLASVATLSAWAAGSLPEVLASLFPGRSGSRGRRHRNAGGVPPDRLRLRVGPPIRVRDGRCENISAPPGRWEPVFSIGMLIWHRSVLSPRRLIDRVLRVRPLWRFDEQRVTFVRRRRRPARERRSLWVIPLEVEDEARGEDWERRLAAAAPPASARTIVFARFGSGRYPPVADWPADPGPAQTYRGPRHLRPDDARPASTVIVQAIGTPVHTMSGMRLRVSDDGPNPSAAGEETLLGIEDLDVSGIPLAVLQADPVDGAAAPLGEDRAGFVDLAIAALDAGAGAVLVIPPLPDELAAAVGAAVQETVVLGMRDGLGRDGRLLAPVYAARRVKDLIYDEVSRDGETSGVTGEPAASESGPGAMGTIAVDDARPGDDVLLFLR